ncbi:MAG: hypothetical protein NTV49_01840, partial [Kiritimatiellaeota bacterium]|nr:hypothetical protein [Kiritimatiellota bacterium]
TIPYDRSHGHLPFVFASVNLQPDGTRIDTDEEVNAKAGRYAEGAERKQKAVVDADYDYDYDYD